MQNQHTIHPAKTAVIYARYSSHNQTEQSIEGQIRDCRTFADREGLTVVAEYIDRAISGRTDARPDFQRMLNDSTKRQFQYVIVWKLDRFARNRYDSAIYKQKLKKCDVRVISAMENIGEYLFGDIEMHNYPMLIERELFEQVQVKLEQHARAPGSAKAKEEYLLQGKIYCGLCGCRMIGESGHGKSGKAYNYYTCSIKKRKHECEKKNEKKDFLEAYVVEQTLEYVLTPERILKISEAVVAEYNKEFDDKAVKDLEHKVNKIEREISNAVDLLIKSGSDILLKATEQKVEELTAKKEDLEVDLAKLKIANEIKYTVSDIIVWLKQFCKGDVYDVDFRQKIIDVFINSVYVYDDKIAIFYNIKGGKTALKMGSSDEMERVTPFDEDREVKDDCNSGDEGKGEMVQISGATLNHRFLA